MLQPSLVPVRAISVYHSRKCYPDAIFFGAPMNGYVLFESVIPPELVAPLHGEFKRVFDEHRQSTEANRGTNRFQMHLPFREPFISPAIIENPLALAIIAQLVGPDCVCHYFASDTALPGSEYQKVHADIGLLFPEAQLSLPPYSVYNVVLFAGLPRHYLNGAEEGGNSGGEIACGEAGGRDVLIAPESAPPVAGYSAYNRTRAAWSAAEVGASTLKWIKASVSPSMKEITCPVR